MLIIFYIKMESNECTICFDHIGEKCSKCVFIICDSCIQKIQDAKCPCCRSPNTYTKMPIKSIKNYSIEFIFGILMGSTDSIIIEPEPIERRLFQTIPRRQNRRLILDYTPQLFKNDALIRSFFPLYRSIKQNLIGQLKEKI
jgi:hypothetical protein